MNQDSQSEQDSSGSLEASRTLFLMLGVDDAQDLEAASIDCLPRGAHVVRTPSVDLDASSIESAVWAMRSYGITTVVLPSGTSSVAINQLLGDPRVPAGVRFRMGEYEIDQSARRGGVSTRFIRTQSVPAERCLG